MTRVRADHVVPLPPYHSLDAVLIIAAVGCHAAHHAWPAVNGAAKTLLAHQDKTEKARARTTLTIATTARNTQPI